mmetsp:Transcript_78569/g.139400  ORF Transcript_78569/g.139400 Transcript_78569/m.139400 type:complete len:973 (+) Transcript_78569:125-3043(+)
MSGATILDEVRRIESNIKEELKKSSSSLAENFRQQIESERQDRQFRVAELRKEVKAMHNALDKAEQCSEADSTSASMGGISGEAAMFWSSSMSQVKGQVDKLRDEVFSGLEQFRQELQQQMAQACQEFYKTASDSEQMALKMSAAESSISELRHNLYQQKAAVESVRQEAAMNAVMHQDIVQQRAQTVDIRRDIGLHNDHMQELNRELDAQRMQLMEQSSKFTVVAADSEELKLKVSVVESALDETRAELNMKLTAAESGVAQEDLSMQSELHSNFVALKETVAQLRSDMTVKSNIYQEHLVQQAALDSLRQEVSQLKLSKSPAQESLSLAAALESLRQEVSTLKLSILPAQEQLAQQAALESLRQEVSKLKLSISPAQEHLMQQAALDSLRQEVSTLKLSMSPTATGLCTPTATLQTESIRSVASEAGQDGDSNLGGLQESTMKLRQEMEQKFTLSEQKIQSLLNLKIEYRLEKVEERVSGIHSRQNAFGDVVQLATTIIKGTQQNQERSIQDSVQMRTFMVQTDQRVSILEKFLPLGQPGGNREGTSVTFSDGADGAARLEREQSPSKVADQVTRTHPSVACQMTDALDSQSEISRVRQAYQELVEPLSRLSKRTATNEARYAALDRRVEQLSQLHAAPAGSESSGSSTGKEAANPLNATPQQTIEDDGLLTTDLKQALESLVTKINHMGDGQGGARSASPFRQNAAGVHGVAGGGSVDVSGGSMSLGRGSLTGPAAGEFAAGGPLPSPGGAKRINTFSSVQGGSTRLPMGGQQVDVAAERKSSIGAPGAPGSMRMPVGPCQPGEIFDGSVRSRSNTNLQERMVSASRPESQSNARSPNPSMGRSPMNMGRDDSTARSPVLRKTSMGRDTALSRDPNPLSSPRPSTEQTLASVGRFKSAALPTSGGSQSLGIGGIGKAPQTMASADKVVQGNQSPIATRRFLSPSVGPPGVAQAQSSSVVRSVRPASMHK